MLIFIGNKGSKVNSRLQDPDIVLEVPLCDYPLLVHLTEWTSIVRQTADTRNERIKN